MFSNSYVRKRIVLCAAILGTTLLLTAAAAGPKSRLIIISWDANADWVVDKLLDNGQLPNVARLARNGVRADYVTPAFPSVTAPGHAAIWTGAYSDVNGVSGNNVPLLPRSEHTLLEQQDGFSSAALKAEPLWLTALLAGKRVVTLSATHVAPASPYLAAMRAAGIPADRFISFDSFRTPISPAVVLTADTLTSNTDWEQARAVAGRAKQGSLGIGDQTFNVLAYDSPDDPTDGFDTVAVCPGAKQINSQCAILKPAEAAASTARWSKPFRVTKGELFGLTYFRLFSLSPGGAQMTLYQRASAGFQSTASKELSEEYLRASGGFTDAGFGPYGQGALGSPLWSNGDGTAERRLLEIVRLDLEIRQRATKFALDRLNPDVIFDYSEAADGAGHTWMGVLDPDSPAYDAATAAKLWPFYVEVFQLQDAWLGTVMDSAGRNTMISLVGDHGIAGVGKAFFTNAVLERAGLLTRTPDRRTIDLRNTKAMVPPWGSYFVSVNSTEWKGGIVPPNEREDVIRRAVDALLAAVDPENGKRIVTRIFRPDEIVGLGMGGPAGGDVYLDFATGYAPNAGLNDEFVRNVASRIGNGVHGFYPLRTKMQTVWFIAGPGIAQGKKIGGIRQIDIAPTLSQLLGIPAPHDAVGHVIGEVFAERR